MKLWSVVLVLALAFTSLNADAAKRLGGGRSIGQQSGMVTQREAMKPAPAAPVQNAAPAAQPAPVTPPPAAPQPARRPWGAMLGGLAAGLGLAWLAHSFGFGAEFGQFLMFGLLALVAMGVIGMLTRRRQPAVTDRSPYAFEGAGAPSDPRSLPQYNPHNVGNDASARPMDTEPAYQPELSRQGAVIGSALSGQQTWGIPADFDTQGFLQAAKQNFITLQRAWDNADVTVLRSMMTDAMLSEIRTQLAERESAAPGQTSHSDVAMLDAQLLGIEELTDAYLASVEFSGMIREEISAGPMPFREVWNMTKSKNGSGGWLVAGVQALE